MNGLLDQVGSLVSGVLDSAPVRLLVWGFVAYLTVVWLASAHWVLRDMRRRRPDPISPYLAATAVVLASPILLPVSAFTYFVLRPRETLAEARERDLTDRLMAFEADMDLACPGCARAVEDHWLVCPDCRTRLAHRCRTCGRTMGLDWSLCGFCGTEFGRAVATHRLPVAASRAAAVPRAGTVAAQRPAAAVAGPSRGTGRRPAAPARESRRPRAERREGLLEQGG